MLASGSLSQSSCPTIRSATINGARSGSEFNRQVDLRVLDLWKERRYAEFVRMLPEYSTKCNGEALMTDTHMIFGLLGWDKYRAKRSCSAPISPSRAAGR